MHRYLSTLTWLLIVTIFSSCNSPLDKKYSEVTYTEDIEAIRKSNKVSDEDVELLTKYIALSKVAGKDLEGKAYADILDNLKEIRKANADKSEMAEMQKDAARARMSSLLTVKLTDKIFSKVNNKDCFTYTVTFQNTSSKNIKMVLGNISVNDLLDREIKNIPILLEEPVRPGAILKKNYTVDYERANENDERMRSKDLVDLRVVWNPVKIIFEDGTRAE
jgi:uncharacterized repeat protein (TIGR01451 family)